MKTIVLAGNPNSGKTSLFNNLTGLKQHVGNWPGKTVEKKEGYFNYKGEKIKILDLPGIYSLSAYSVEEAIAKEYIIKNKPDIIVNIVDASNLERNLYLTLQLIELNTHLIVALNMNRYAESKGQEIDIEKFSAYLGVPVVAIEAIDKSGKDDLISKIFSTSRKRYKKYEDRKFFQSKEYSQSAKQISDPDFKKIDSRYRFIKFVLEHSIIKEKSKISKSDKIDKLVTNKYLGIPIFLLIMFVTFQITFTLAEPIMNIIDVFFGFLAEYLIIIVNLFGAPAWISSFIVNGVIAGVGSIIIFLPNILLLFFCITMLEDSGYLSRAAYVMDRPMSKIGLHGKAFIPLILGFGCNVPAIMATRTLTNKINRIITIMMIPFMSCSARIAVYILFVNAFFPKYQSVIIFLLYLLGIFVAVILGLLLKIIMGKKSISHLMIELPPYRLPRFNNVFLSVWKKAKEFLTYAGTIIFSAVIVVWFLGNIPFGVEYASKDSFIGIIGNLITPIFSPLGFGDWKSSVALLFGFIAKEVVVGTFGTLYGVEGHGLINALQGTFTPLSAISFLVFTLLYIPCIATIAVIKRETNSWRWTVFAIVFTITIAWIFSFIIYQGGLILGFI